MSCWYMHPETIKKKKNDVVDVFDNSISKKAMLVYASGGDKNVSGGDHDTVICYDDDICYEDQAQPWNFTNYNNVGINIEEKKFRDQMDSMDAVIDDDDRDNSNNSTGVSDAKGTF